MKVVVESPDGTKAAIAAQGPGTEMIGMPASTAALISSAPGSLMPGVPASLTRAMGCGGSNRRVADCVAQPQRAQQCMAHVLTHLSCLEPPQYSAHVAELVVLVAAEELWHTDPVVVQELCAPARVLCQDSID